jgi:hypothetical protein
MKLGMAERVENGPLKMINGETDEDDREEGLSINFWGERLEYNFDWDEFQREWSEECVQPEDDTSEGKDEKITQGLDFKVEVSSHSTTQPSSRIASGLFVHPDTVSASASSSSSFPTPQISTPPRRTGQVSPLTESPFGLYVHPDTVSASASSSSSFPTPHISTPPRHTGQVSPPRTYSPFPRRDSGIRPKNKRFNIPPERTMEAVDRLIAHSTNDDEIKELKQQKRLLRNRQAAYESTLPSGFRDPC